MVGPYQQTRSQDVVVNVIVGHERAGLENMKFVVPTTDFDVHRGGPLWVKPKRPSTLLDIYLRMGVGSLAYGCQGHRAVRAYPEWGIPLDCLRVVSRPTTAKPA